MAAIKIENIGRVPINYTQNEMFLHEQMAEGDIHGQKFTVNNAYGSIYVTFQGLKGSLPKISIKLRDLVQCAYDAAKTNNLFKEK